MKLLYVTRDPPGFGGAERRLLEIVKILAKRGHTIHVLSGKTRPNLPDYEIIDGVHFHYFTLLPGYLFKYKRFSFYASRYLFYFLSLFLEGYIRRIDPDIIIDYVTPSPSLIYLLARLHHIPCVGIIMEFRDYHQWLEVADPISARLGFVGQNFFFRRFKYDLIFTISKSTYRQLVKGGIEETKLQVIPLGITPEDYQPEEPVTRRQNTILVVGRLMPQKGHTYLLEAFQRVKQEIPEAELWIVGDGPLRDVLSTFVEEQHLDTAVTFTGNVSEAVKTKLLWEATLFAMPSLQEGFGVVLLEAMACELPIVAFDLPVYREWFDGAVASFVPRLNTNKLALSIVQMIRDNRARERMAKQNITSISRFTWQRAAEMEEQCLMTLIK